MRVSIRLILLAALSGCGTPSTLEPALMPVAQLPEPDRTLALADAVLTGLLFGRDGSGAPAVQDIGPAALAEGTTTWLGHAGFLVRIAGQSVLIDPNLSDRIWRPRLSPAPSLGGLERLDAVLITHEHADHYDLPTLRRIAAAFPQAVLVVPPQTRPPPDRAGFAAVTEIRAWQTLRFGQLEVTATPAVHYGRRHILDFDPREAFGYALRGGGYHLFHAGDTARGPVHAEIGERLGPFDLALVPIGDYAPEGVVGHVHANPETALMLAADLGATSAFGMHWGTFARTLESPAAAVARFRAATGEGLPDPIISAIGQTTAIRGP